MSGCGPGLLFRFALGTGCVCSKAELCACTFLMDNCLLVIEGTLVLNTMYCKVVA